MPSPGRVLLLPPRRPVANPKQRRSRRSTFHLPLPEDRSAIQASIGEVLQRIAANDIDPRRAGLLLYGLQIASLNLPKPQPNTKSDVEPQTVEEITIDPTLGVLAPRTDISETARPKSAVALLIERMMEMKEEEPAKSNINKAAAQPAIVPILQATEDTPEVGVLSRRSLAAEKVSALFFGIKLRALALRKIQQIQRGALAPDLPGPSFVDRNHHFRSPRLTSGSNTPCPPARRAYTQSSPWRQASDRHRAPRIPGPQNPCSWSQ
jgi:hypothetical protein